VTLDALKGAECKIEDEVTRGRVRMVELMGGLGLGAGKNAAEKEEKLMWDIDLSVDIRRHPPLSPGE
jgi:hypothetical protein